MQITVNEPGARTIRDSRPMQIDGQNVYVVVGGGTASLMVAGRIVAERTAETMSTTEAQTWAVSYRDERDAVAIVADEDAVAEACNPEAVYAGAVEQVRAQADQIRAEADLYAAHGEAPARIGQRQRRVTSDDPRHPARRAEQMYRDADRLAAWTATDEQAYGRYVSDGIGDTDGYFAPIGRAAWKATLGA
jgi:hypothetical protein